MDAAPTIASPEAASRTALESTAPLRAAVTETASTSTAPQSAAFERNAIMTPRLIFLMFGSRCRKTSPSKRGGVDGLAPMFCGFVPIAATEPLREPGRSPRTVLGSQRLRQRMRQQHDVSSMTAREPVGWAERGDACESADH